MTVRQPYTDPPLNVQNIVLAVAASAAGDAAGGSISSERRRKRGADIGNRNRAHKKERGGGRNREAELNEKADTRGAFILCS